ncbi:MAG: DUF2335 domain-containing protein [Sulfurisoma sp.]|nr:DUF2335 domain-containing protein [Sulfurisoma sp.]
MAKPPGRAAPVAAHSAVHVQHHQGPLPAPEDPHRYEALIPSAAERIIRMAEDESAHRRLIEGRAHTANIDAQARQMAIADYQSRATFHSDAIGQAAGLAVSLACIAGAVFLAQNGREWVAGALAAIPTPAVIHAFLVRRHPPGR